MYEKVIKTKQWRSHLVRLWFVNEFAVSSMRISRNEAKRCTKQYGKDDEKLHIEKESFFI